MPAPVLLSPLTLRLLALGGTALAAAALRARRARADARREAALDRVDEGLAVDADRDGEERSATAEGRWRRVFRLGANGPGVELDIAAIARARIRPAGYSGERRAAD